MKIGLTCAFLNISGNFPEASDMLKSRANGPDISMAVSFNNFTGIPSGPVGLFTLSAFGILNTSFSEVVMFSMEGTGDGFCLLGMGCRGWGRWSVDCLANCLLRREAFFKVVVYNVSVS